jgi:exopolysaccharide biosynthesis polyprenyl glycosylphosphotransferase
METNLNLQYTTTIDRTVSVNLDDKRIYFYLKRAIDIGISIFGLIITFPILVLTAIAIKFDSHGPIFYFQERVGYKGVVFKVIKLRSMVMDAEKNGEQWAEKKDSRITRIGYIIRKTRIDEIPQLINVLVGQMSIIGPRPERPSFTEKFNEEIPGFKTRLLVKPGITGWAQVNGGYDITPQEKLVLDLYYIQRFSLLLDLKIYLKTIKVIITGHGAR